MRVPEVARFVSFCMNVPLLSSWLIHSPSVSFLGVERVIIPMMAPSLSFSLFVFIDSFLTCLFIALRFLKSYGPEVHLSHRRFTWSGVSQACFFFLNTYECLEYDLAFMFLLKKFHVCLSRSSFYQDLFSESRPLPWDSDSSLPIHGSHLGELLPFI